MHRAILTTLVISVLAAAALAGPQWRQAGPDHSWDPEADMHAHREYRTEWWYFTGHLQPRGLPSDRSLPFQLTFFRLGMVPGGGPLPRADWAAPGGLMAHAALADPAQGSRIFSEVLRRETPQLAGFGSAGDTTVAWCRAPAGTDGVWSLTWDGRSFGLSVRDDRLGLGYDLRCRPIKPPVLHGQDGFSAKTADGSVGSLYASFTRMEVTGTVLLEGRSIEVDGECWMDREIFSNTLAADQKGWDWVSLQLEDGREVMLYRLFDNEGRTSHASGTVVERDGTSRPLAAKDWELNVRQTWTSPQTDARYPIAWDLEIPSADLDVHLEAVLPDQENRSEVSGVHYWEGGVRVIPESGTTEGYLGRGFVEMTGYGEGSRPPV